MSKKVILVVEDSDDTREILSTMLETLGYTVRGFADAASALDELTHDAEKQRTIDLALLDIMLPGMDGYGLLAEIKKIPQYAQIPVIMVTAKDADTEVIEGYKHGADYYITKPFTLEQLQYGLKLYL